MEHHRKSCLWLAKDNSHLSLSLPLPLSPLTKNHFPPSPMPSLPIPMVKQWGKVKGDKTTLHQIAEEKVNAKDLSQVSIILMPFMHTGSPTDSSGAFGKILRILPPLLTSNEHLPVQGGRRLQQQVIAIFVIFSSESNRPLPFSIVSMSFSTKGTTDYTLMLFYVNSLLPKTGGYSVMLSNDGYTIRWSQPIDSTFF